jgi:putative membrane protein
LSAKGGRGSRLILPSALIFAAISGFFVARFPVRPELAIVSAIFVLVFAWPSYAAIVRWLGAKRGIGLLVLLGVYALVLETVAVKTGVPYGRFSYGPKIGKLLFDAVPWTVPFSWTPLALWALALSRGRSFLAGALLVGVDLCLDPGAVAQEFWRYEAGGAYFSVPLSNFLGWLLSGSLGAWLGRKSDWASAPTEAMTSGLLSIAFWTSVCLNMGLWVPGLIGVGLLTVSLRKHAVQ